MDIGAKFQSFVSTSVLLIASTIADSIAEAAGRNARLAVNADSHFNAVTEDQLTLNQRAVVQGSAASPVTIFLALAAKNVVLRNGSQARETHPDSHSSRKLPQIPRS